MVKKDTRARMLETTARLLQHRGYYGTSLSDILEESVAPRGSLYFHFPGGKDELVIEATRAAVEETTEWLRDTLSGARNPAQGVRAYLEAVAALLSQTDYTFGCPVAPVILDAHADLAELADLCRQAFEEWVGLLRDSFAEAGIPERRAHALALLISSSVEGLLLIARAYRDISPLMTVAAELEGIVEAALPRAVQHTRGVSVGGGGQSGSRSPAGG
jgi:TetR/AcrR family transcriptional regulator, lmrAB and yxaGH operons repressor